MGCAFAVFNLFGLMVFFLAAVWVANLIGLTRLPANLSPWVFLAGLAVLLLTVLVISFWVSLGCGESSILWMTCWKPPGVSQKEIIPLECRERTAGSPLPGASFQ